MTRRTGAPAVSVAEELHPARLLELCGTSHCARRIILFDRVGSTNAAAMASVPGGAAGEMLFIAEEQTLGKGRKGRSWLSAKGKSIVFSLLLKPARRAEGLTAILALATIDALGGFVTGLAIKWPNDVFLKGKKVGGILAESRDDAVVLGLGLNVNEQMEDFPAAIADEATSMRIAARRTFDRGLVLCRILVEFERLYDRFQKEGFATFREEIQARLLHTGKVVAVESGGETFTGRMIGITNEGYLCLDIDGTERVFSSGDLTLRERPGRRERSGRPFGPHDREE
jgi:BirA family biotin operon repressor/biotin-[acetyl-CoA-carboxylase] ligase